MNPQRFVGLRRVHGSRLGEVRASFWSILPTRPSVVSTAHQNPRVDVHPFWRRTTSPPQIILNRRSSAVVPVAASHAFLFLLNGVWRRPYELKMAEKLWQGADLIFDLDGDHLPG